jgi:signal transduction histidine kinase
VRADLEGDCVNDDSMATTAERRFALACVGGGLLGTFEYLAAGGSATATTGWLQGLAFLLVGLRGVAVLMTVRKGVADRAPHRFVAWNMALDAVLLSMVVVTVPLADPGFVAVILTALAITAGVRYGWQGAVAATGLGALAETARALVAVGAGSTASPDESAAAVGLAGLIGILVGLLADDARRTVAEVERHHRLAAAGSAMGLADTGRRLLDELFELGDGLALLVRTDDRWHIVATSPTDLVPYDTPAGSVQAALDRMAHTGRSVDLRGRRTGGLPPSVLVPARLHGEVVGALAIVGPRDPVVDDLAALHRLADHLGLVVDAARTLERELHLAGLHHELDDRHRTFAAVASHELRTPLAALLGFTDTMIDHDGELDVAQRADLLHRMRRQGERLQRLVDDLDVLSALDADNLPYEMGSVTPSAVVDELLDRHPDVEIVVRGVLPDVAIRADATRLVQALDHVVENAATHGRPPVLVSWVAVGDHVRIDVADHGDGIPAEDCERVFDRFVQLEDLHAHCRGTGLGLPIVRSLVQGMSGEVAVSASGAGGARITLVLPRAGAPVGLARHALPPAATSAG